MSKGEFSAPPGQSLRERECNSVGHFRSAGAAVGKDPYGLFAVFLVFIANESHQSVARLALHLNLTW